MRIKRPTKKQIAEYRAEAKRAILAVGGEQIIDGEREYRINTTIGPLWVSIYDDWLACRFDDVQKARTANLGERLNPHSGKWNWHDGLDSMAMFEHIVAMLVDNPVEQAALCVKNMALAEFGKDLTDEQAKKVWLGCRKRLVECRMQLTARNIEAAYDGVLDDESKARLKLALQYPLAWEAA